MAIEKRQTLGEVTGTLGDIVRRKRYGKIVVSRRPSKYRKSKSKAAVDGRNSFALSVAFAKAVNSIPHLKQVWQLAKLDGVVAYNRIIKYNKQFIKDSSLTVNNIITPKGIFFLLNDFSLQNKKLVLSIDLKETDLKKLLTPGFYIHIILYAFNATGTKSKEFFITAISTQVNVQAEKNIIDLEIALDTSITNYLKYYKSLIVYAGATNYSGNKKSIFWTNTVAKQFEV
jgi:hypothetical protein